MGRDGRQCDGSYITQKSVVVGAGGGSDFRAMAESEPAYRLPKGTIPICHGSPMALIKATPRVSSFPEQRIYRCAKCGRVETLESYAA
jgi:hypothetical protein